MAYSCNPVPTETAVACSDHVGNDSSGSLVPTPAQGGVEEGGVGASVRKVRRR